jgi:hypothetical protein
MMSKLGLQENEPAMLAPLDIKGDYSIDVLVDPLNYISVIQHTNKFSINLFNHIQSH